MVVRVFYSEDPLVNVDPVLEINNLNLCTLSSKVSCPIKADTNILKFNYSLR